MYGNGVGLYLRIDLGSGATYRGVAGSWQASNLVGVTGAVSTVGTNGAQFYMTGVKLEIGSVATSYNRQSLAKSMADCQRYYQALGPLVGGGYCNAGATFYSGFTIGTTMRASPTAVLAAPAYGNASGGAVNNLTPTSFMLSYIMTATAVGYIQTNLALSAEL